MTAEIRLLTCVVSRILLRDNKNVFVVVDINWAMNVYVSNWSCSIDITDALMHWLEQNWVKLLEIKFIDLHTKCAKTLKSRSACLLKIVWKCWIIIIKCDKRFNSILGYQKTRTNLMKWIVNMCHIVVNILWE